MPNAGLAPPSGQQPSPGNSLPGTLGAGRNESPQSNPESYEYDWSFAQELLNRAGMPLEENNQLPLLVKKCPTVNLTSDTELVVIHF
jgi:hypothetical protein